MPNRADRRKAHKALPAWKRQTKEQKMAALVKNGITPKDLEREGERSWNEGYKSGVDNGYQAAFAALCLALKEKHRFGKKRCVEVLRVADYHIINTLTTADLIREVYDKIGIYLDFNAALEDERVREA